MVISLNYCSQNGGHVYRAPYYNRNPNIGPHIIGNLDQYPNLDGYIGGVGGYKGLSGEYRVIGACRVIQVTQGYRGGYIGFRA